MKNAILIGMEFQSLLPAFENPMYTEGYEGFYHLDHMEGNVEQAVLEYIIRDHDREKFEKKKVFFQQAADFLNQKYGENTVQPVIRDSYYNMREVIEPHFYLVVRAKAAMEELGITPRIAPSVAARTVPACPTWAFPVPTSAQAATMPMENMSMSPWSLWNGSWSFWCG